MFRGGLGSPYSFFLSGFLITTLLRREYEQKARHPSASAASTCDDSIELSRRCISSVMLLLPPQGWAGDHTPPSGLAVVAQFAQLTDYYLPVRKPLGDSRQRTDLVAGGNRTLLSAFPLSLRALARTSYLRCALVLAGICVVVLLWRLWLVSVLHRFLRLHFYRNRYATGLAALRLHPRYRLQPRSRPAPAPSARGRLGSRAGGCSGSAGVQFLGALGAFSCHLAL